MKIGTVALALASLLLAAPAGAQTYKAPRTAHGQPDLQGVWTNEFMPLPLEARPDTPSLVVTDAESKALALQFAKEIHAMKSLELDPEIHDNIDEMAPRGLGVVKGQRRTRQVVAPESGRLPYTPQARAESTLVDNLMRLQAVPPFATNNPEDRPNAERCLVGQGQPPIANPAAMNPRNIVQTRDQVVIQSEYGNDVRIISFTDKHAAQNLGSPLGSSIARWEGETLVVETVGMPAKDRIRPLPTIIVPASATVIERFTRVGPDELLYQYTIVDPTAYSAPWLAEYSLYRSKHSMLEFACHEGNYSLGNILAGARGAEGGAVRP